MAFPSRWSHSSFQKLLHWQVQPRDANSSAGTRRGAALIPVSSLHPVMKLCKVKVSAAQSCPTLAIPWTIARPFPLSTGFSRQEHWSGMSCPSPGDLPDPGIEPQSLGLQVDSLPSESPGNRLSFVNGCLINFLQLERVTLFWLNVKVRVRESFRGPLA